MAPTVPPAVAGVPGVSRGPGARHQLGASSVLSLGTRRECERSGEEEAMVAMMLWEGLCWVGSGEIWVCPLGFA